MLILPNEPGTARYTFSCDLDNVTYNFAFEWNDRDSGWYLSLSDVNGAAILSGRRIVLNYPLTNIYRVGVPPGNLMAIDTTGSDVEPGLLDLGDRVVLTYTPFAELVDGF